MLQRRPYQPGLFPKFSVGEMVEVQWNSTQMRTCVREVFSLQMGYFYSLEGINAQLFAEDKIERVPEKKGFDQMLGGHTGPNNPRWGVRPPKTTGSHQPGPKFQVGDKVKALPLFSHALVAVVREVFTLKRGHFYSLEGINSLFAEDQVQPAEEDPGVLRAQIEELERSRSALKEKLESAEARIRELEAFLDSPDTSTVREALGLAQKLQCQSYTASLEAKIHRQKSQLDFWNKKILPLIKEAYHLTPHSQRNFTNSKISKGQEVLWVEAMMHKVKETLQEGEESQDKICSLQKICSLLEKELQPYRGRAIGFQWLHALAQNYSWTHAELKAALQELETSGKITYDPLHLEYTVHANS